MYIYIYIERERERERERDKSRNYKRMRIIRKKMSQLTFKKLNIRMHVYPKKNTHKTQRVTLFKEKKKKKLMLQQFLEQTQKLNYCYNFSLF